MKAGSLSDGQNLSSCRPTVRYKRRNVPVEESNGLVGCQGGEQLWSTVWGACWTSQMPTSRTQRPRMPSRCRWESLPKTHQQRTPCFNDKLSI